MKLTVGNGIDQYLSDLQNLKRASHDTLAKAIYEGSAIVADEIKSNIQNIPIDEGYGTSKHKLQGMKQVQKQGLLDGFGIAPLQDWQGFLNVKIGFHDFNNHKTKSHPNGQPNSMIARTFESGNSFTQKQPFVGPAVRATKEKAERKMAQIVDEEVAKTMNV